jgi:dihydroorotase
MDILIKEAEIICSSSPFHNQKKNIYISNGVIKTISDDHFKADHVIEGANLKVSIGWFDMWAFFGDPGHEHKEDLDSGCMAAAAGGFTGVALLPNSHPPVQTKNAISYLKSHNHNAITQIFPFGAVTVDLKGEDITEMIDMSQAGAVAFTDGFKPLWNTDILLKSLLYLKKFGGLLIQKPEDKWLNMLGVMNESTNSAMLGLKGMPSIAEEITIERDLRLLEYSGGKIHFANISTARSVEIIRKAKKNGMNVTCDIAAHQIAFDDSALLEFETQLKVNPPFRGKTDIEALIEGLKDDTIDLIVSSHNPHDEESKNLEFDMAEFGIIGLQTLFPVVNRISTKVGMEKLIMKITEMPRKILGIEIPELKEGAKASLTVFDPETEWVFNEQINYSKSDNSPFLGQSMKGKVIATINNNLVWINE